MSLLTQAYVLDRYGMRVSMEQLAELLDVEKRTLYNKVSAKTLSIPTYVDNGKRWADYRDVAQHFDALRESAAISK